MEITTPPIHWGVVMKYFPVLDRLVHYFIGLKLFYSKVSVYYFISLVQGKVVIYPNRNLYSQGIYRLIYNYVWSAP